MTAPPPPDRREECPNCRTMAEGVMELQKQNAALQLLVDLGADEATRQARSPDAERLERMNAALISADEFLQHSGNQRAVLSGQFSTPSARYDWFLRVKNAVRAAMKEQANGL